MAVFKYYCSRKITTTHINTAFSMLYEQCHKTPLALDAKLLASPCPEYRFECLGFSSQNITLEKSILKATSRHHR